MTAQRIVHVALSVPLRRCYDYCCPVTKDTPSLRGMRVKVPFGKQERIGIVISESTQSLLPSDQLKNVLSVLDDSPILPELSVQFIEKIARYYHHPIGEVAFTGLPQRLRQGKDLSTYKPMTNTPVPTTEMLELNAEQQQAVTQICDKLQSFHPFLLDGITGSGKTEVYLVVAASLLSQNKQLLVLVPEISLTPQTLLRFQQRFGAQVLCFHSDMTPAQRFNTWMTVRSGKPLIVVGTRSALFLPFTALGAIICDEEHDPSFKQQEGFRYSARDSSVLRAQLNQCPVILGSATPSFESLYNSQIQKYTHLKLTQRATQAQLPKMHVLDVKHQRLSGGLSSELISRIKTHLEKKGQVLLFINRRGFSPTLMCFGCGWMAQCNHCDARLTYHHQKRRCLCHHCLAEMAAPTVCPSCASSEINPIGYGTERLEDTLTQQFPDHKVARIDSDATQKVGSLELLLDQATKHEAHILIGTQMLAKGHHFPHLTLVAIVDADLGLFSVDFRAIEKMAQLIIQVAGRAGRVHQAGEVVIQTFHPEHPLLQNILAQDYAALSETLLKERASLQLPPYAYMAMIRAQANDPTLGQRFLKEIQQRLKAQPRPDKIAILGPVPAPMLKRQGQYRYQLLLQSPSRQALHALLNDATQLLEKTPFSKRLRWSLDVDPIEMH